MIMMMMMTTTKVFFCKFLSRCSDDFSASHTVALMPQWHSHPDVTIYASKLIVTKYNTRHRHAINMTRSLADLQTHGLRGLARPGRTSPCTADAAASDTRKARSFSVTFIVPARLSTNRVCQSNLALYPSRRPSFPHYLASFIISLSD